MKSVKICITALIGTMLLATTVWAATGNGNVRWSPGSPSAGAAGSGTINVAGTFQLDPGYVYKNAVVAWWPVGGGTVTLTPIQNPNGNNISGSFTGTSGTRYNIILQVGEKDVNNNVKTLASDTAQYTAP